jgi:prolipoprotein diacylglyceryltransferase
MIEFLKTPQEGFENNMLLNMGQWLSMPAILTGLMILFYAQKHKLVTSKTHLMKN